MGACVVAPEIETRQAETNAYAQKAAQLNATLRAKELPTGETLVPMNYISGEHPIKYPAWFNQQQLSAENWVQFLAQLNQISVPIISSAVQQMTDSALPHAYGGGRSLQQRRNERLQTLRPMLTASHSNLVDQMDALFLQWNQNVFKPVGLQCFADYDAWYTLIENGIYGDSMSNKRVGFLMKAVSAQQAMAVQPVQTVVVVQSQSEGQKQELPLPPGWSSRVTSDGRVYYIDDVNKTTQWQHPAAAAKETHQ